MEALEGTVAAHSVESDDGMPVLTVAVFLYRATLLRELKLTASKKKTPFGPPARRIIGVRGLIGVTPRENNSVSYWRLLTVRVPRLAPTSAQQSRGEPSMMSRMNQALSLLLRCL